MSFCWVFVAYGGASETADTQQRSPTHAPKGAAPALKLASPPTACAVGERAAARAGARTKPPGLATGRSGTTAPHRRPPAPAGAPPGAVTAIGRAALCTRNPMVCLTCGTKWRAGPARRGRAQQEQREQDQRDRRCCVRRGGDGKPADSRYPEGSGWPPRRVSWPGGPGEGCAARCRAGTGPPRWQAGGETAQLSPGRGRVGGTGPVVELRKIDPAGRVGIAEHVRGMLPVAVRGAHFLVAGHLGLPSPHPPRHAYHPERGRQAPAHRPLRQASFPSQPPVTSRLPRSVSRRGMPVLQYLSRGRKCRRPERVIRPSATPRTSPALARPATAGPAPSSAR